MAKNYKKWLIECGLHWGKIDGQRLNTTQLSLVENWEAECTHPTKNSWFLIMNIMIPCIPSRENTQVWVPRGRSRLASLIMTLNDSSGDFIFLVSITLGSERFEFLVSTCLAGDTRVLGDYELWLLPEHFELLCPGTRQEEGHCLVRDHRASGGGWAAFYTTEAGTNVCGMQASHLGASEYSIAQLWL